MLADDHKEKRSPFHNRATIRLQDPDFDDESDFELDSEYTVNVRTFTWTGGGNRDQYDFYNEVVEENEMNLESDCYFVLNNNVVETVTETEWNSHPAKKYDSSYKKTK